MNAFSGTLSSSIGSLVKVKELMLSRTQIEGAIPTEFGQLVSAENLELYGNRLTGPIPDLGLCTNLKRIGELRMSLFQTPVLAEWNCILTGSYLLPQTSLITN